MIIDPPPSHQAARYLVATALFVAFLAAIIGLLVVIEQSGLVESVRAHLAQVRGS